MTLFRLDAATVSLTQGSIDAPSDPSFTAAVYDDEFQLIVKASTEKTFWVTHNRLHACERLFSLGCVSLIPTALWGCAPGQSRAAVLDDVDGTKFRLKFREI